MWHRIALAGILILAAMGPARSDVIRLVTYHVSPPYIIDIKRQQGLTYELARRLSLQSKGQFEFVVEPMSRPAVNDLLHSDEVLVLPWVNPLWFTAQSPERFYWSREYTEDGNALISLTDTPFDYSGPQSLVGRSISGLKGGRWIGIDPLVEQKQVERIDAPDHWSAMRQVIKGQSDMAIVPYTIAKYLIASQSKPGIFYFSTEPHSQFSRRFLVKNHEGVGAYIDQQIEYFRTSPEWASILASFGL